MPFAWNEMPNTATGILHVSRSAWDYMDMAMENGLPSSLSIIDADIEALDRWVLGLYPRFTVTQEAMTSIDFCLSKLEISGDMALRDDQHMQRRNRELVSNG